jgi:hypothetical protein
LPLKRTVSEGDIQAFDARKYRDLRTELGRTLHSKRTMAESIRSQ